MGLRRDDYLPGKEDEDTGCARLATLLGRPVRCLACPLPKCLEDMTIEEVKDAEERLRLLLTEHP